MASYRGLRQVGEGLLDYMMKHRPGVPEEDELLSQGLHDLEELFPGIYKDGHKWYRTSGDAVTSEAMAAINAARGNPDAEIDIFRAEPQGVRDFNVGDWVTTSKSYAHKHGGHALNGDYDIITGKAKASDLYNPGDSIAEMGYWGLPMAGKVTRGLIPAVGAGGLLALLDADEAEAAPKPSYMLDLVKKLEEGNFENGMEFGAYTARDLKKNGLAASGFTPGPIKISPKNLAKFEKKRIGQNHMTPEQFVDGLNSVLHGTRGKAFPNKGDLAMRLSPETDWNGEEPFVRHFWKGVVAPHDGFTGLVTGHKYNTEDAKKDLKRFSGERPSSPFTGTPKEAVTQQGEVSVVENASGLDESTIPASSNSRKAIIPLIAGGAVLAPSEAQGTPYQFPADKRGTVLYEPGLGSPIVDPADLLTAPIGVPTAALKAASVAAEPFISYGMDKAIGGLLSLFSDEEGR